MGALGFVFGLRDQDAINLQLLGGRVDPADLPRRGAGAVHPLAAPAARLLAGWAAGMLAGTWLVADGGFSALVEVGVGGYSTQVYAAVVALAVNLAVAVALTRCSTGSGCPAGPTRPRCASRGRHSPAIGSQGRRHARLGSAEGPIGTGTLDLRDPEREAAIARVFDESHARLVRLAVLLGAGADAEDIVAEAFCQLYRRWPRLRSPDAAAAYVRGSVVNLVRMRLRHLQVVRRHVERALRPQ